MRHSALFLLSLLSTTAWQHAQSLYADRNQDAYGRPASLARQQHMAHLLQQQRSYYDGTNNIADAFSFRGTQITLLPHQQQQQQLARNAYNQNAFAFSARGAAPPPPPPPSMLSTPASPNLWSGAPIVVDCCGDAEYATEQEQQRRLRPLVNNAAGGLLSPAAPATDAGAFELESRTPQTFLPQGQSFARNFAELRQQDQSSIAPSLWRQQQFAPSGGATTVSSSDYSPLPLRVREYSTDVAPHFQAYVRKYPHRLQPIFGPNDYDA